MTFMTWIRATAPGAIIYKYGNGAVPCWSVHLDPGGLINYFTTADQRAGGIQVTGAAFARPCRLFPFGHLLGPQRATPLCAALLVLRPVAPADLACCLPPPISACCLPPPISACCLPPPISTCGAHPCRPPLADRQPRRLAAARRGARQGGHHALPRDARVAPRRDGLRLRRQLDPRVRGRYTAVHVAVTKSLQRAANSIRGYPADVRYMIDVSLRNTAGISTARCSTNTSRRRPGWSRRWTAP